MFLLKEANLVCGSTILVIDDMIPTLTTTLINLIKIGVPLLLIFFGMLDLGKAVMAQKEDEIKKGQQMFIKRLIAAVIVFLVIFVVQLALNLVGGSGSKGIWHCVDCFTDYDDAKCNQ